MLCFSLLAWGYWYNLSLQALPAVQPQPIYQGSSREKEIALTVNVFWGEEYLPQMLDILEKEKVQATFFIGGQWAEQFPGLTRKIHQKGHEIGSHGYAHPHPDQLSVSGNLQDIRRAEEVLVKITGERPKLFAPPYGEHGPAVLQAAWEAGYRTILWSVDTVDWQRPEPQVISSRVLEKAHNGAIVLMHPTAPTVEALPVIIKELKARGYRLITVSHLLRHLEGDQQPGTTNKT
ncbi:polysaccharide deacetylase family protein [Desulfofundulus salinus]|nr:polysaccharide deacetylase family protein [Desulfofundulus salinum]